MKRIARTPTAIGARPDKVAPSHGSRMRGQALVETALVLPVLLLLLLMAVDFGRLFMTYVAINNAAREGAFYAAEHAHDTPFVGPSFDSAVRAAALREVNVQGQGGEGALAVSAPVCHVTGAPNSTTGCDVAATSTTPLGYQVTVSVTQPFSLVTPIVGDMFGGAIDLSATSTAPVLNAPTVTVLPSATPTPTPTPTATPTTAPTPTPTPDPAATPTPTPDPAATPTPTPSPTPEPTCTVPDLIDQFYNTNPSALFAWQTTAGFTGALIDSTNGHDIQSQSRTPGGVIPCSSTMEVSQGKNLAYKG